MLSCPVLTIINGVDIFKGREKLLMHLAGGVPYKRLLTFETVSKNIVADKGGTFSENLVFTQGAEERVPNIVGSNVNGNNKKMCYVLVTIILMLVVVIALIRKYYKIKCRLHDIHRLKFEHEKEYMEKTLQMKEDLEKQISLRMKYE